MTEIFNYYFDLIILLSNWYRMTWNYCSTSQVLRYWEINIHGNMKCFNEWFNKFASFNYLLSHFVCCFLPIYYSNSTIHLGLNLKSSHETFLQNFVVKNAESLNVFFFNVNFTGSPYKKFYFAPHQKIYITVFQLINLMFHNPTHFFF